MEKYIEVGVTSARDPITREFLPAVPMYIKSTSEAEESEAALIKDLGKLVWTPDAAIHRGRRANAHRRISLFTANRQKGSDNLLYRSEYFYSQHSSGALQQRVKRLERICIVLSISILLIGFAGIRLALKTAKMIDTVALATERVDIVCDEIENALNTHSQYKCDNIIL